MAAESKIVVTDSLGTGAPGESRTYIPLDGFVSLTNYDDTDVDTWEWVIVGQPPGSPTVYFQETLTNEANIANPTFQLVKEGSYLIRLTVNKGLTDESTSTVVCAVRELMTGDRIPAPQETIQTDNVAGWSADTSKILQRVTRMEDAGVFVGVNGGDGWLSSGDVVYIAHYQTVGTGDNARQIPALQLANTVSQGGLIAPSWVPDGFLGVVAEDINGNTGFINFGEFIRVVVFGRVRIYGFSNTWVNPGTPVYLGSDGKISLTPATKVRVLGYVLGQVDNTSTYDILVGSGANTVPLGGAGGDLTGTYPNPTIASLRGVSVPTSTGVTGHVLQLNGSSSAIWGPVSGSTTGPAGGDLTGTYPNPTIAAGAVTTTKVASANRDGLSTVPSMRTLGTGAQQACAGNDSRLSNSRTPTGAAGGVLAGTYPNPNALAGTQPSPGNYNIALSGNTSFVAPTGVTTEGKSVSLVGGGISYGNNSSGGSASLIGGSGPGGPRSGGIITARGVKRYSYVGEEAVGVEILGGNSDNYNLPGNHVFIDGGSGATFGPGFCSNGGAVQISGGPSGDVRSPGPILIYGGMNYDAYLRSGVHLYGSAIDVRGYLRLAGRLVDVTASTTIDPVPSSPSTPKTGFSYVKLNPASTFTFTSAPTITTTFSIMNQYDNYFAISLLAGFESAGVCLRLQNGSSTHSLTFQKDAALGGPLVGSKLALKSNTVTLLPRQILDFMWDGEYWVQAA